MHGQPAARHIGIRHFNQRFAFNGVRVAIQHFGIHDGADGHTCLVEMREVLGQIALRDEAANNRIQCLPVFHAGRVIGEARIGDQRFLPDGTQQFLRHALRGSGKADPAAILGAIRIARRCIGAAAAGAWLALARQAPIGQLRFQHAEKGLEQRNINHLPLAGRFRMAQRDHGRRRAIKPGIGITHEHGRQHGFAVFKTIDGSKAGIAFHQSAKARLVPIRPILPPAGNARDDKARIGGKQALGIKPHGFQHAGAEAFHEHRRAAGQGAHGGDAFGVFQIKADAFLVAANGLPACLHTAYPPGAQSIAFGGFHLDHFRAVICKNLGQDIAGDQPRKINDPHALHRAFGRRVKILAMHLSHGINPA